jgi:hypothetical protein
VPLTISRVSKLKSKREKPRKTGKLSNKQNVRKRNEEPQILLLRGRRTKEEIM